MIVLSVSPVNSARLVFSSSSGARTRAMCLQPSHSHLMSVCGLLPLTSLSY